MPSRGEDPKEPRGSTFPKALSSDAELWPHMEFGFIPEASRTLVALKERMWAQQINPKPRDTSNCVWCCTEESPRIDRNHWDFVAHY